ncbi:Transposase [Calycomorphotria hydatis]|uniref:Transposase n=1 Tax=Calycomorphotria hydatis TaxID=2528027 RepID=A0A517T5D2_9PLAN|nr:transposase [Calycomorphotria hydatis]QDT63580.1 Transposase [Calycomorphotria hydatis]
MKKSRFTNEQIAFALKQAESGVTVEEVCRKLGKQGLPPTDEGGVRLDAVVSIAFYRWKKKFDG